MCASAATGSRRWRAVAHIPESQRVPAERRERFLEGAFGLGKPPRAPDAGEADASTFTSG